jgi:hypothetical protein
MTIIDNISNAEKRSVFLAAYTHYAVLTLVKSAPVLEASVSTMSDNEKTKAFDEFLIHVAHTSKIAALAVVESLDALKEV